jgi:hypothetical protein
MEGNYSITDFKLLQVNWNSKVALYDASLITGSEEFLV